MEGKKTSGFTLIELMVAVALMLILTASIVVVFSTAKDIYLQTDAQVQVYQNARFALDVIDRDLANTMKTGDMEFFKDAAGDDIGRGHFNKKTEQYKKLLELKGNIGRISYAFAPVIMQNPPYESTKDGVKHRRDVLYFRSVAEVEGKTRQALIMYRLLFKDELGDGSILERPILQRIAMYIDEKGNIQPPPPFKNHWQDLCYFVTDFEIETYYSKRREQQGGTYLSAREAIEGRRNDDTPKLPDGTYPKLPNWARGGGWAISTVVMSDDKMGFAPDSGPGTLLIDNLTGEIRLRINGGDFDFEPLVPGDSMWVYPQSQMSKFQSHDLTIRDIRKDDTSGSWYASFVEDIAMPPNTNQINVNYRAGWLPAGIRIKLTIKDSKSLTHRTISRVFLLLRS